MLVAVVILTVGAAVQSVGTWLSKRCDKRLKH